MIFGKNANLMLCFQKAKAKMVEYGISNYEYNNFELNSNELSYPATYVLSRYSECIIENNLVELKELEHDLEATAEYYDFAFKSKDRRNYDWDFLLSGASAYFFKNNFGSAKVLAGLSDKLIDCKKSPQRLLANIYNYLLSGKAMPYFNATDDYESINNLFINYIEKGVNLEVLRKILLRYRKEIYVCGDLDSIFYVDILIAVIIVACDNSSQKILPSSSDVPSEVWNNYLQSTTAIKMLWPSQRLIADKGGLRGESLIVQLPTGVGKTRSVELIIRASFLSKRARKVIIIAPLRALCNEIEADMHKVFKDEAEVNQFSDVLQEDFQERFWGENKLKIFICTPEKFSYILHQEPSFIKAIDLCIIDEAHMFDNGGRGVTFELLLTYIRQNKSKEQQLVLLSAVLSNSADISRWLFYGNECVATDSKINSTFKAIGFSSEKKSINFFYGDNLGEHRYIPVNIIPKKLKRLPNEKKDKFFPDLSIANDVAIYNAINLCANGGVAIYVPQQRSINTIFKKISMLDKHGYDLSALKPKNNSGELQRIKELFIMYYGEDHYYTKSVELGILPHYANLQNGVKLAVEYALKHKYVSCVVCTSTLSQGVNIPIKYLLVTNIRNGRKYIKVRDFQNLVGRIARAGIFTEGTVIVADSKIFDNRNKSTKFGRQKWEYCSKIFNPTAIEPCRSSILSLVQDFFINDRKVLDGKDFIDIILEYIDEENVFLKCKIALEQLCEINQIEDEDINKELMFRIYILSCIENYLCLNHFSVEINNVIENSPVDICKGILAYVLASEKERKLLENVFQKLNENLQKCSLVELRRYSKAMNGIQLSSRIEKWIIDNKLTINNFTEEKLLSMIIDFYLEINSDKKNQHNIYNICQKWIKGMMPIEISTEENLDIKSIDDICSKKLSYELNFFIGNIRDLIIIDEDKKAYEDTDLREMLTLLQNKVKYGVSNMTAISICEHVFNDRLLAMQMSDILCDENIKGNDIINRLKMHKDKIFEYLEAYPIYFTEKIKILII